MTKSSKSISENNESVTTEKTLFQRVGDFLESKGWNYRSITDHHYHEMMMDLESSSVRMIFDVEDSEGWNRVKLVLIFPVFVPKRTRDAVMEKINVTNRIIDCGSFDIDLRDGEIRYRNSLETMEAITDETLQHQFVRSLYYAEVYFEKLMAMAFKAEEQVSEKMDERRPEGETLQ